MHGRGTWLWRIRRAGAIATALLLLVCVVVVQAQEAAMVHVRCAEHGQLQHVTSASELAATTPAAPTIALLRWGASAGHEHCALVGAKHGIELDAPPPVTSVGSAIEPTCVLVQASYTTRPTFRTAPKNSPPCAS